MFNRVRFFLESAVSFFLVPFSKILPSNSSLDRFDPRDGFSYVANNLALWSFFAFLLVFFKLALSSENFYTWASFIPLLCCVSFYFLRSKSVPYYALGASLFTWVVFFYPLGLAIFQYEETIFFQHEVVYWSTQTGIFYHFCLDAVSLFFVSLSNFVIVLCILASWNYPSFFRKEYFSLFLFIQFLLIHVFTQQNVLLFFVFFESVLIPMFLIIGVYGSRIQRVSAAYRFFLYTLLGSSFMLIGIFYIYSVRGTLDWFDLLELNRTLPFSFKEQVVLWALFFIGFAVKVPLVPFHTWLPEAHVEAPTAGSMLLAGVLLKMGGYGIFHFLLPLFPLGTPYYFPVCSTLCLLSIFYGSLCAVVHIDIKKIVAYSSVAHMGYSILGLLVPNQSAVLGSLMGMISHGFISTGLFFCIGVLYERYGTRNITNYSCLTTFHPRFAFFFFIVAVANTGFPGTSSFVGEIMVLAGLASYNLFVTILAAFSVVLSALYSLWLFGRLMFAVEGITPFKFSSYSDLNRRETFILICLSFFIIFMGFFPSWFVLPMAKSVVLIISYISFF